MAGAVTMKRDLTDPQKAERIVEMQNISSLECYRFPDETLKRVLADASLLVIRSEVWGITCDEPFEMALLMEIMGNIKPYEGGRCSLSQLGMMRSKRRVLEHMFYINDQKLMYPHMNVLSWLMFASQHTGGKAAARQVEWLELLLALDLHDLTLTYSRFLTAAEQVAVALMLTLKMMRIQLVLIDLSHIDVPHMLYHAFSGIIERLRAQGKSVVLASAQRDLIQKCASHAAFLLDGMLERQGTVSELCEKYDTRHLLVRSNDLGRLTSVLSDAFSEARIKEREGEAWIYEGSLKVSEVAATLERSGIEFEDIEIAKPSLDLAFREAAS
jgi:ABC-2 type transport system ATP-binding protein